MRKTICSRCSSTSVRRVRAYTGSLLPFENVSRPRVEAGEGGWVHRWLFGELTMFPVTDFTAEELYGIRWVWVRHLCNLQIGYREPDSSQHQLTR